MQAPKNFNPVPFDYHQEIELTIDTLTNLGVGLGRKDNWVVMVPFALPGEKIKARIYKNYKNYSEGDLLEILEPSKDRVKPQCDLFGLCGGCQYQHLGYEAQLQWKTRQVQELFLRLAKIDMPISPIVASEQTYNYRAKLTPHFEKPIHDKALKIGFLKQGTRHTIIDVPYCPIATQPINIALKETRTTIESQKNTYKKGATLLLRDVDGRVYQDSKKIVCQTINNFKFKFVAGEFFQNNLFILPKLIDYVVEQTKVQGADYLVDAYCGVGMFGLAASKYFKKIIGIEVNTQAIELAKENATLNSIDNAQFLSGLAEKIFEEVTLPGKQTAIILDPPRKGCDMLFLEQLIKFDPLCIVYVSCAPDTQARDVLFLTQNGYKIQAIQPFDLFPQTRHMENVVTLKKNL